jgi:hypothetical protein
MYEERVQSPVAQRQVTCLQRRSIVLSAVRKSVANHALESTQVPTMPGDASPHYPYRFRVQRRS